MLIIGSLFQANFTRMTGYLFKKTMYTHCGQLLGSRCTQCYPIVLVRRTYFSGKNASLDDQSRIYLQSLGVDLGKVNKTFRNRIIWSLDVIEPKIRILLKAGIEKSSICQMIIYRPRILNMNEDILKIRLVFLKSLGLTESKLSKLLSEHSFLLTYQESDAQNLLSFLQSRDFNKFKAWDIIIKRPRLILVGAQNLRHTLKFTEKQSRMIFDLNPSILGHSQNSLQRKCDYLIKKMGYSHQVIAENAAILSCSLDTIMYRYSSLSKHSVDKELVPIAQLLLSTDDAFQEDILNGRNYIEIESKDTMELQSEGSKEQHCS
ncbi:uncharacterized protein TRIADDRAFT_59443 [Trichoplax adhaerens]|uniref:Uncharacterized protein n=1 Tax=Trichoplax adhaerens TaxID=10228 RepID=B3S5R0_TRIAD|nr:hypothetical protein TRIADDRAFT_59443 [Trichoplax adhaerens]EDV21942.1 hypothetical protein TRIADDRAFT_59443 [Trichoplax adhaerens]|eukprot:XP_002115579.1 hypothetical protein TRIADDRAFT_59443 [Trichoplax adhaerens]